MAHPQIIRAQIEGMNFTLYYDYDQLQDGKLSRLTDDGKIEWFRLRMEFVFLEPLRRLFRPKSTAYRELNSTKQTDLPARSFVIATFSVLLNGIEALGSFLTQPNSKKKDNFCTFLKDYMKFWDSRIQGSPYQTDYLPEILWSHFRNGIAHGFVIEGGGIDYEAEPKKRMVVAGRLEIGPIAFFKDFLEGTDLFFSDVKIIHRASFLRRFQGVYPH